MGIGYMATLGDITSVWNTGGFELDFSATYRFIPWLGVELCGLAGFTGIASDKKVTVTGIYSGSGLAGSQTSEGGMALAMPFGLKFYYQVPSTRIIITAGGGGYLNTSSETGLSNVENYSVRTASGLGYYWCAGVYAAGKDGNEPVGYGLQLRYTDTNLDVHEFYPPLNTAKNMDDKRLIATFDFGMI